MLIPEERSDSGYTNYILGVFLFILQEIQMKVLSFCFCKDKEGHVGLVKSYSHGYLTVIFDDGRRDVRPSEVSFL